MLNKIGKNITSSSFGSSFIMITFIFLLVGNAFMYEGLRLLPLSNVSLALRLISVFIILFATVYLTISVLFLFEFYRQTRNNKDKKLQDILRIEID